MEQPTVPEFLGAVYCDIHIKETLNGHFEEPIEQASLALAALIGELRRGSMPRLQPLPHTRSSTESR